MEPASDHLDQRRRAHEALAERLAAMSDDQLAALAAETASWRANVHGNQVGVVDVDGVKVFVKKIALTDLERGASEGATANLFDLPLYYHYGVGSSGFGAWRELSAYLRASAWTLSGEHQHFPLLHHWRVLPRMPPTFSTRQLDWLERAPDYWGSDAVGARLDAIAAASACIVLFLEHVPETLHEWLKRELNGGRPDATLEATMLRFHDQWRETAAFMNDRGMLHFDLNASNVLTDGRQIYAADFGLAICADFDLSPAERDFFEAHGLYDRCYVPWSFAGWLTLANPPAVTPALSALIDRYAAVADTFGDFLEAVQKTSKTTPYPATELAAAVAAMLEIP